MTSIDMLNNTTSIDSILIDSISFDSIILDKLNEMECPICYEIKKENFYGKCAHSWCMECHSKMVNYYTCPICRTPFSKPPEPIEEIWVGHDIVLTTSRRNGISTSNILRNNVRNRRRGVSVRQRREEIRNRVDQVIRRRRSLLCDCVIS